MVLIFLEFTDKAKVSTQGKPSECVTHLREKKGTTINHKRLINAIDTLFRLQLHIIYIKCWLIYFICTNIRMSCFPNSSKQWF